MMVSLSSTGADFPDQDRDRLEQNQLLLLPRLSLQGALVTDEVTLLPCLL